MYFTNVQWLPHINRNDDNMRGRIASALEGLGTPIPGYPEGHYKYHNSYSFYNSRQPVPDTPPFTEEQAAYALEKIEEAIRNRDYEGWSRVGLSKWTRPWDVVPELRQFSVPEGDFGVGIEVEMGFKSTEDAAYFCNWMKDWKYVTFDYEGGDYPIEATFPPMLYSEMNNRSLPFRYLRKLTKEKDRVFEHRENDCVGTHINVSKGGITNYNPDGRLGDLNRALKELTGNKDLSTKYFGRRPYGLAFNQGRYIEFKLFNSQLSDKRLRQYIDMAVSLVELVVGKLDTTIDAKAVHIALEEGFCKSLKVKPVVEEVTTERKMDTFEAGPYMYDVPVALAA